MLLTVRDLHKRYGPDPVLEGVTFDVRAGERIARAELTELLWPGSDDAAGRHSLEWDGRDAGGRQVASGTYLFRIDAGPYSETRKMTLMK